VRTRAAVLREVGRPAPFAHSRPLSVEEVQLDPPGPGEVLVAVRSAGLCHSDLSVVNGNRPRPVPMALGHEAAGEVLEVGAGVSSVRQGDHVVMVFVPGCGSCRPCDEGRPALCEPGAVSNTAGTLLSGHRRMRDAKGGELHHHLGCSAFAEHAVVSEHSLVVIDPELPWDLAAVFGCAVLTGAGAVINTGQAAPGSTIAVVGLGGVGLAAVLAALAQDCRQVIAVDVHADKLALALSLGATDAVEANQDTAEVIREISGGGVDLAVELAGSVPAFETAYRATRRGGTTVTGGLPHPAELWSVSPAQLVADERTIKGSYIGSSVPSRDIPSFLALHRNGRLPVEKLLGERIGLDAINEGLDTLASGHALRQIVRIS